MECDIGDVSGTPCIHTQSCHHYRPAEHRKASRETVDQPIAQMLISMLQSGEVIVQRTGDVSKLKKFFLG